MVAEKRVWEGAAWVVVNMREDGPLGEEKRVWGRGRGSMGCGE